MNVFSYESEQSDVASHRRHVFMLQISQHENTLVVGCLEQR